MRQPFLFLFIFLLPNLTTAQSGGYGLSQHRGKIEIPFEYKNGLMVVDVMFNRFFPLKFIFDTGAENTILAKKEITDLLGIPYEREFTVMGSDLKTELKAYLIRDIHFEMGPATTPRHAMLVLDEDYFRFEEVAGLEVHGIIGADAFRGMVVKINYERKLITLTQKDRFHPPKGYGQTPIEVFRNKAYLETELWIQHGKPRKVKLLLDTGAMVSLLLNTMDGDSLALPPNVLSGQIGAGLGGFIEGYLGRVSKIKIGETECRELLTNFQEVSEVSDTSILNGRNGILGNRLMSRYHLVIDYPGGMLYYKPNKKFKTKDEFDKSGLVVIAADVNLNKFLVHDVLKGSPSDLAGVEKGDRILKINGIPAGFMTLGAVHRKLRKKEGKRINLMVKRNGERLKFRFVLRKLI